MFLLFTMSLRYLVEMKLPFRLAEWNRVDSWVCWPEQTLPPARRHHLWDPKVTSYVNIRAWVRLKCTSTNVSISLIWPCFIFQFNVVHVFVYTSDDSDNKHRWCLWLRYFSLDNLVVFKASILYYHKLFISIECVASVFSFSCPHHRRPLLELVQETCHFRQTCLCWSHGSSRH